MKALVLILFCTTAAKAAFLELSSNHSDCIYEFDKRMYKRTAILRIEGLPTNLVYRPKTDELYFTLIDFETLINDDVETRMDLYILKNGDPILVTGINGQASALDSREDKLYIAADDGLYVLNETHTPNFVSLKGKNLVQIYKTDHNDDIYVTVGSHNLLRVIDVKENELRKVNNVPDASIMAVDSDDNVFYECNEKYIKVLLKGFQEPIEYVGIKRGASAALTVDATNRVILAAVNGLYHLKPDNVIPEKLMNLEYCPSGIEFDKDDFYMATKGIIYKYSNDGCNVPLDGVMQFL